MKRWFLTGVWWFSHILVVACGASGGLEAPEAEFRVTYTSPEESQVILERRPQLYVVFSRPLDASTVSTDTVSLQSEFGEDVRGSVSVRANQATQKSCAHRHRKWFRAMKTKRRSTKRPIADHRNTPSLVGRSFRRTCEFRLQMVLT